MIHGCSTQRSPNRSWSNIAGIKSFYEIAGGNAPCAGVALVHSYGILEVSTASRGPSRIEGGHTKPALCLLAINRPDCLCWMPMRQLIESPIRTLRSFRPEGEKRECFSEFPDFWDLQCSEINPEIRERTLADGF